MSAVITLDHYASQSPAKLLLLPTPIALCICFRPREVLANPSMLLDEPKSMYNGVPHRIKAEVEEKEDKKDFIFY
jgi:hypothetical protein